MTQEDTRAVAVEQIITENRERFKRLTASYNPYTGEDTPDFADRELLEISDFAIPKQYIPSEMMQSRFARRLQKCGSIQAFIEKYPEANAQFDEVVREILSQRRKYDFLFWAYTEVPLLAKEGDGIIRFVLNSAQRMVFLELEKMRKSGRRISIILLKARQWGGSTLLLFYQWWLALKWRETYMFSILAQTNGVANDISDRMSLAIQNYDAYDLDLPSEEQLRLVSSGKANEFVIRDSKGKQVRFNKVRIGSIIAPDNLRGLPGFGAHFSEMGVWPSTPARRPMDLIKSITAAIPRRPYTMVAIESTAKGSGNDFHKEWLRAKRGESNYKPVFVAWYMTEHDIVRFDSEEEEREFAQWLYDHKTDDEPSEPWLDSGKYYWYQWQRGATLQGINWYRMERREYDCFADMASEAPTDDIEAFQNSGEMVFNFRHLEIIYNMCKDPVQCGMLFSDAVEGAHVLNNIHFEPSERGLLKIWEFPDKSMRISDRYIVAVDVAGGMSSGADFSVIRVFDRAPLLWGGRIRAVATLRYHIDPDYLAYDAMRIAAWYNNALLVIESNTLETRNPNRNTDNQSMYILDIIAGLYPNLYARRAEAEVINEGMSNKWGFHTNARTKPALIGHLKACVREQSWVERDTTFCDEASIYEFKNGAYNAMAGAGNHDDVLMTTAIALWISNTEMEMPRIVNETARQFEIRTIGDNATKF